MTAIRQNLSENGFIVCSF